MAAANIAGAAALQGLADDAVAAGAGLDGSDGDDDELLSAASGPEAPEGAAGGANALASPAAAPAAKPAVAAAAGKAAVAAGQPAYGVSAELAAIAKDADPNLGLPIVQALAISRKQPSMPRTYVKNLEAADTVTGRLEAIWPTLSNPDRADFRRLAGFLFIELVAVDPTLDPTSGPYDASSLAAALRELMELCAAPYRAATPVAAAATAHPAAASTALVPYDPSAAAAAIGAAMATALGAAFAGLPSSSKPTDRKVEKLTAGQMYEYLDKFNARPGAETQVGIHQVANRTVAAHVRDSVLVYGLWPQDKAASTEAMSPFGTLMGTINGTDVSALEFNLSSGKVEDVSRDPKAKAAATTEEYLVKVRLLLTTIAVFLYGVKCDKAPHLVVGHETEDFCSILQCNQFLTFVDTLARGQLVSVSNAVELTLSEIAQAANARASERVSFTHAIKGGLVQLKRRAESFLYAQMTALSGPGGSGPDVTPPAVEKSASRLTEESIAELLKAAVGLGRPGGGRGRGKGAGRRGGKTPADRAAAYEERKRAREVEHEYNVNGTPTKRKAQRGGYSDAPKCTRPGCHKDSWCWYSHAHL
jgi:hypothetical protein